MRVRPEWGRWPRGQDEQMSLFDAHDTYHRWVWSLPFPVALFFTVPRTAGASNLPRGRPPTVPGPTALCRGCTFF